MKALNVTAIVLLVIGGLNWGLWGVFRFDLVARLFGGNTDPVARIVYIFVGLTAVYQAFTYSQPQSVGR